MTIVLEHQFWDLESSDERFAVTLSLQKPARAADRPASPRSPPSPTRRVKFGLQFQANHAGAAGAAAGDAAAKPAKPEAKKEPVADKTPKTGEVVALDAFRKK